MRLSRFLTRLAAAFCATASLPVLALDVNTPLAAYRHDVFDARAGAPRNAFAMAQTADGWLWFGTSTGLYRYDGVRFEAFQPQPGEHVLGQYVGALLAHPDGDLWIGYLYGGVSVLHDGHLRHLPLPPGKPMGAAKNMAADGDAVWVASSSGLLRYRDGHWQRFGADRGLEENPSGLVYRDPYGRLWASGYDDVRLLDRASERFVRAFGTVGETVFVTAPDGRVWAADGTTVRLLPEPPGGWHALPGPMPARQSAQQTLFDRDGNYWTGNCPSGICVLRPIHQQAGQGRFPDLTRPGARNDGRIGNASATVTSMLEDREGNLWAATTAGVERLRDTGLVPLVLPPGSGWPSVALDGAGNVWIASTNLSPGGRLWKVEAGAPVEQRTGQDSALVAQGRDGTVLVGGTRWIERRLGQQVLARYPMPAGAPGQAARDMVMLLAEDRDGIWLYQGGRGLLRLREGTWTPVPAQAGLARAIYALVDDEGRTWFGTRDNRVVMVDGDRRIEYGSADGIALGAVTFVHVGRERIISGDNGTAVWNGTRFRPLRAEDNDLVNVSGLVVTAEGDRWLNTKRGLFHVKAADWQRSMADPDRPLRGTVLDGLDGFPGANHSISPVPTLHLDGAGRLWVNGTDGVALLDRARIRANAAPPAAAILALVADGRHYGSGAPTVLPAGTERVRFDFTAPSLTLPERVRFHYHLDGFDHGWLDAGTTRAASYTNLGPGEYRFEVRAVNEDGVAGPVATTAVFRIEPTMVQTRWFAALCVLASGLALWRLYRWRLGRIQRAWQMRMDERLAERERIARTLHDTFLQGLQSLMFHLDAVAARLAPASQERAQIENLLDVARKVTDDGRSQVMDLRTGPDHADLGAALAACAEALRMDAHVQVAVEQVGTPRDLAPDARGEVEAIAREAIANAFRHAGAGRIDIRLDWTAPGLVLAVLDDGAGMAPRLIARGRPGHWGLRGMRERAARIGASLSLRNRPGGGVEVRLDLGRGKPARRWPGSLGRFFARPDLL